MFAKSHNYNYLNFQKLANYCTDCIQTHCKYERENKVISYKKMYEKFAPKLKLPFRSFDELFYQYENHPAMTADVENLLDPNFDKKLIRARIYEQFRQL